MNNRRKRVIVSVSESLIVGQWDTPSNRRDSQWDTTGKERSKNRFFRGLQQDSEWDGSWTAQPR